MYSHNCQEKDAKCYVRLQLNDTILMYSHNCQEKDAKCYVRLQLNDTTNVQP